MAIQILDNFKIDLLISEAKELQQYSPIIALDYFVWLYDPYYIPTLISLYDPLSRREKIQARAIFQGVLTNFEAKKR